jgi:DNA-binding transcriptional MerR regulator
LRFIAHGKRLGFSLKEIRELLELRIDTPSTNGCSFYRQARNDILDILVEESDRTKELRFASSPTIKINGGDLEDYQGDGIANTMRQLKRGYASRGWIGKGNSNG